MSEQDQVFATIEQQLKTHRILIYMKGSPERPQCGFSQQACQALFACDAKFGYVDVLQHPEIRQYLPLYANWPTFPQLYVDGELIGGCDIITELYEQGSLKKLVSDKSAEENE